MTEKKDSQDILGIKVPLVGDLEGRFSFIQNDTLRQNIAVTFQYVIFLIVVMKKEKIGESTISSSIYKNMITHTAAVVEGCLHYCLKEFILKKKVKEVDLVGSEKIFKEVKVLYKIDNNQEVIGAIQSNSVEKITNKTNLIVINRLCKKARIISDEIFREVENLRETRNNIHLMGLRGVDSAYKQKDAQKVFDIAKKTINAVKDKISELRRSTA